LALPPRDERREKAVDRRNPERRATLAALCTESLINDATLADWPGAALIERLQERRKQLASLTNTAGAGVLATIDRFLLACDSSRGRGGRRLLAEIVQRLGAELEQAAALDWCEVGVALLLGKENSKTRIWESGGALLFDSQGDWKPIYHAEIARLVSVAMNTADSGNTRSIIGRCALTGETGPLVESKFPQPNLPVLGQTYLFARNKDIPANDRYGRLSANSMPVGQNTIIRLAAAAEALTADEREGITWRSIPGESPKQTDLLLAFAEAAIDAPVVGIVAGEDEGDLAEEAPGTTFLNAGSIAAFEKRTQRVVEAVQAYVRADFTKTPVCVAVLRKVDPANRKVAYSATPSLEELLQAARSWVEGQRNVPIWLTLPVPTKDRGLTQGKPPHVMPLGLIGFGRQLFLPGGSQRQEVTGIPASEVLALFLDEVRNGCGIAGRRVLRILRLVLDRRASLVTGAAHALRRGLDAMKKFDRHEALRTVTVLGVLLHKLGRDKEEYMSNVAFRLGQLLAAADVVHAGYCADVRGGDVPPSLLGNQVFTMAQTAPIKALAVLCRRWKPYDGWAKKASRNRSRADLLVASSKLEERNRGWDIKKGVRVAREIQSLADVLRPDLAGCAVDDVFRAELLLGYIAGLPNVRDKETGTENSKKLEEQED
jgi:hypothetical protein